MKPYATICDNITTWCTHSEPVSRNWIVVALILGLLLFAALIALCYLADSRNYQKRLGDVHVDLYYTEFEKHTSTWKLHDELEQRHRRLQKAYDDLTIRALIRRRIAIRFGNTAVRLSRPQGSLTSEKQVRRLREQHNKGKRR